MNLIEKKLLENIKNLNTVFVFPTQTPADLWADRIITISDVSAVAMDRFMAWDTFKGKSIRSQHQDKTSIPSSLRQIFAAQIVNQNAENPFLKNIIIPEYAKTAGGFTNWICSLLPSLSSWKKYFDKCKNQPDDQDLDLLELYNRYSAFLSENSFFDPAWELPPFEADGKKYIIFFPEILEDYYEYETILRSSTDIEIVSFDNYKDSVDQNGQNITGNFFNNSRTELKNVVNFLKNIHENAENPINWNEIAISVPNFETYGAYISRELTLAEIPHLARFSTPLSSTGAGCLFDSIQEIYNSGFSYDSIKALVLNSELPWKDDSAIHQLISFGQKNHCICSFNDGRQNIDVWEKSFAESPQEEIARTFYETLKKSITSIVNAENFAKLHKTYFEFREKLFDMEKCTKKTDLILSRCITELSELIELEKNYESICKVPSPLSFFANYISKISYLEQSDEIGVQIYPYRLAATAPFACHIIVDSSQAALSVIWEQLKFLRDDKRKMLLGREDPNVTDKFIKLYNMNSYAVPAYFTVAEKTFDGYSQVNSYLTELDLRKVTDKNQLFGENPYIVENDWILQKSQEFPKKITEIQQKSAKNWILTQNFENSAENIQNSLEYIIGKIQEKKLSISKTQMDLYNTCPRKWLFEKFLSLKEENNAAVLMDQFQAGNLYHKVFELFCKALAKEKKHLHVENGELNLEYQVILKKSISNAIEDYENPYITKQLLQTTREALENTVIPAITAFSTIFEDCEVLENEGFYEFESPEKNYKCIGIIDCLLKDTGSGETILIDFKSTGGGIPNQLYFEEGAETPGFQMPLYTYVMKNSKKNITVDNCAYFNIKDQKCVYVFGENLAERMEISDGTVTAQEFEKTVEFAVNFMDNMAGEILTEKVLNPPENIDFSTCWNCNHRAICRKSFNVGKKE